MVRDIGLGGGGLGRGGGGFGLEGGDGVGEGGNLCGGCRFVLSKTPFKILHMFFDMGVLCLHLIYFRFLLGLGSLEIFIFSPQGSYFLGLSLSLGIMSDKMGAYLDYGFVRH